MPKQTREQTYVMAWRWWYQVEKRPEVALCFAGLLLGFLTHTHTHTHTLSLSFFANSLGMEQRTVEVEEEVAAVHILGNEADLAEHVVVAVQVTEGNLQQPQQKKKMTNEQAPCREWVFALYRTTQEQPLRGGDVSKALNKPRAHGHAGCRRQSLYRQCGSQGSCQRCATK